MPNSLDKTMRPKFFILTLTLCLFAWCASAQKVKDFANRSTLQSNDLFSVSINAGAGTRHVSFGQISNELGTASTDLDKGSARATAHDFDLPFVGFDTWPAWSAAGYYSLQMGAADKANMWVTNLANALNATGLNKRGLDSLWLTDGWENSTRSGGNLIQSSYLAPIADIAKNIHAQGCRLMLYTSVGDTTCAGYPGTPLAQVDNDIRWMMDRNVDGCMFDTCNTAFAQDVDYLRTYALTVNRTIADYHARVISTQGTPRPFFVAFVSGNGSSTPGTNITDESYSRIFPTFSWNWNWEGWHTAGGEDVFKTIMGGKEALNYATTTGPGHYPWPTFLYELPPGTNQVNMVAILSAHTRMRAGIATTSTFANEAYSGSGYGAGYEWWTVTNIIAKTFGLPEISAIHRDGGVIPPKIVWTNGLTELWVKPLGTRSGPDKAVLLVNLDSTTKSFTVTADDLNINPNTTYTVRDPWHELDVATFTGSFTYSVTKSNTALFTVKPATTRPGTLSGIYQPHSFREATLAGTGASVISATSYGPAPFYNVDGVRQTAGNTTYYFYFPTPPWATIATIVLQQSSEYAGTVAWTNAPGYEYYNSSGRSSHDSVSDSYLTNTTVVVTSGSSAYTTNVVALGSTTAPRMMVLNVNASTNASARNIIGPAWIKFE